MNIFEQVGQLVERLRQGGDQLKSEQGLAARDDNPGLRQHLFDLGFQRSLVGHFLHLVLPIPSHREAEPVKQRQADSGE